MHAIYASTIRDLKDKALRIAEAEAKGDTETLAAIGLSMMGLEWVDSIDELAAEMSAATTPAHEAAEQLRQQLRDECESIGLDPARIFN